MYFKTLRAGYYGVILVSLLGVGVASSHARGQAYPNTITFENQSGDDALVKLIGPVRYNVPVPNGANRTVNVPPGDYYIVTRYCDTRGRCRYEKGDPFTVEQTDTEYSVITITLHKVPGGQYHTRPATPDEFDRN